MNGTDLLAEFRATRAEGAFSGLVQRYTGLVFSAARRRTGEMTLAQEVTQLVFIRLAKSVPSLKTEAALLAWLHRTTVHVSIDLWRSETRRRAREQLAIAMQPEGTENPAWNEISPQLDEALNALNDTERQTILLRFFEQKTMRELGRLFGVSEDAAKMRVSRALERLRTQLSGLGVKCSAVLLGTLLVERSVEAAPEGLAAGLAGMKLPAPAAAGLGLASLLMQVPKIKLFAGLTAAVLLGATAFLVLRGTAEKRVEPAAGPSGALALAEGSQPPNETGPSANTGTNNGAGLTEPDPYKLLQGVARARQRIASGLMEFDVFYSGGSFLKTGETNNTRLKILFEDGRYRSETFAQEYSYVTPIPGGPEAEAIIKRANLLDRATAVREDLLKPFDSHHVIVYDGQAVTDYWETETTRTDIDKPGRRGAFIFDPRCLGISTSFYVEQTIQSCLPYKASKALRLAGKESVDGIPAWHIEVESNSRFDFWIDVACPIRVLKVKWNGNVALSRFDDSTPKDPLPAEVRLIDYQNGVPRFERRVVRLSAQYDIPIAPVIWTLEGLGMKVGTQVIDCRSYRSLGYWTGTGLSENLPRKDQESQPARDRTESLAILDSDPASTNALDAAQWLMLNTPDGADVAKAAEVILQNHIESPGLVKLTQELERLRPNCSSNLLQAMLERNPHEEVRGNACLALATLRKDAADFGRNKAATAEAEKLYERVIAEFGDVKQRGFPLPKLAQPELSELRRLTIGKVAPEVEGEDLDGQSMKLSDYRGKVVALFFWSAACPVTQEARDFRRLVQEMEGKPFVLIGIHADDNTERAKKVAEKNEMNWRSFQDARSGPISKAYNINSWPNIYVLDQNGVIRNRGLHWASEVASTANELLGK